MMAVDVFNQKAMHGRGVVSTTSKTGLDELIGEDSHAIEVIGGPLDRALILEEIQAATFR
jgi:hypothetical protein